MTITKEVAKETSQTGARMKYSTRRPGHKSAVFAGSFLAFCMTGLAFAETPNDLFELSIEELVNLEVTSVSRKAEPLADATSAVFVITRDDIERHGIRSIPDALRLAPGLNVAQIDGNKWAIGSRGFSGRYANKLLVLMDGRLLYTPSFSGVFWDVQNTLIEEIERIEVIRGPGAVAWGTNAVSGVVNIITRSSREAAGGSVVAGLEPAGGSFVGARYEGSLSDSATYRAFANYQSVEGNELVNGLDGNDEWSLLRASVRADWAFDNREFSMTVEGYSGEMGSTNSLFSPLPPYTAVTENEADVSGAFALGKWSISHNGATRTSGTVYVDFTDRESYLYDEERTTVSIDLQHQRDFGRHQLMVGGWLRANYYDLGGSDILQFTQEIDSDTVVSAFVQDEIELIEDRLSLNLGLKLEDNELSPDDVEVMPSIRLLWRPADNHSVWAAATRAVRTPSIADLSANVHDIVPPYPPGDPLNPSTVPARVMSVGNPDFESESNRAYELGMRGKLTSNASYDIALFTMEYDNIRSFSPGDIFCSPTGVSYFVDPLCFLAADSVIATYTFTNVNESTISGFEATLDWMIHRDFRLRSALSYAKEDATEAPGTLTVAGTYPEWQFSLRPEWSPTDHIDIAALIRYVDEVEFRDIEDYWQANLHVRWSPNDHWVTSLGVRNLLDDGTFEYNSELGDIVPTRIERTAFVNLRYSF